MGGVSFFYPHELRTGDPHHVQPIAYLCVGYPEDGFPEEPVLQDQGWRERIDAGELIHENSWNPTKTPDTETTSRTATDD